MGRVGTPDECASTVAFLVSDDAAYITGENVVIAGGMQSHL
jgi:dehydrogenase/reductase SDR family protein 4